MALPLEHYAANSMLAEGKWVKIKVSETGMQFLSNAQLKQMGFSDPSKVNVFGYGGRRISEVLNTELPDDLPCQPVVRTSDGIVFFGVNTISWKGTSANYMSYTHSQNIYSNDSYYFLSDREIENKSIEEVSTPIAEHAVDVTEFTERLLHEKELYAPANTGATLLGEDFRTNNSQTFSFNLPGHTNESVKVLVGFGSKVTGSSASLTFKANGKQIQAGASDVISHISSSDTHMRKTTSTKTITDVSDKLDFEIKFSTSGVLYFARLDYLQINYERELKLGSEPLFFYQSVSSDTATAINVAGCTNETQIWDVTKPHNPKRVIFDLKGDIARFAPDASGLKEYVAFNPEKIVLTPTFAADISNQNLHAMPVPDMVIITPPEYITQAKRIATLHEEVDNMSVYVLTPEEIYNEFSSGVQDFSAYRKMLKMWYDRSEVEERNMGYCLLFGRPTYDNRMITERVKAAGYPRIPIWQSESSESESGSYSTDDLIGMLEDCKNTFDMSSANLSIGVGRMPVKSLTEATQVVDKLIKYVKEPNLGAWRNNVMIIADDEDSGDHLDQAQSVYKYLRNEGNGKHFVYERLYLDSYPLGTSSSGKSYPQAKERMMKLFDEGVMYVDYIGHANPTSWTHEGLLNYSDIVGFSNPNLMFMLTATCEFTRWDSDDISGAEIMFLNPTAGAIGFISATRKVYITNNGYLNNGFSKHVFERDADGKAKRVGDIYREGKNEVQKDTNKLRYMLMADPAMRLQSPTFGITVDEIGGINPESLSDAADYPVIPARGKVTVKGRITDASGATLTDFNGVVVPTLFDAEKAIETYGHGEKGVKKYYNDRKNKLYTSKVPVVDGNWEATILMPSEIDNNYSPALLNLYAYSDDGREANGSTESFYVYGWNEDAEEDLEGPEIQLLALNNDNFEDGDAVSNSPLLLAKFRDDSGINISTSGIGHQITAIIDGKKVYDNLVDYYDTDMEDYTAGTIRYPLSELETGEHTLEFTVWDNANNSSTASISFKVSNSVTPTITDINTNANPASTDVTFFISHDMPSSDTTARVEVFDLSGKKVWTSATYTGSSTTAQMQIKWDLLNSSGTRVPRGIYLYRAVVSSGSGEEATMTKKLAVTAQ